MKMVVNVTVTARPHVAGEIPGILPHQFKPIRLDLTELYGNPVLDLKRLLFRH